MRLTLLGLFLVLVLGTGSQISAKAESLEPVAAPIGKSSFQNVDPAQFEMLRKKTNTVVLDVRTQKEFDTGHIPGATLLDVNSQGFASEAAKLDKSKTYLVHCAAGVRSVKACKFLEPMQFKSLYNLEGGFKAWEKAGNTAVK